MAVEEQARVTQDILDRFASAPGRSVHVVINTATDQLEAGSAQDDEFPAASLLKLPLTMAIERAVAMGRLDARDAVSASSVRSPAPGLLHALVSDPDLSVADLVGLAIALSDNDAADWLFGQVGLADVDRVIRDVGCGHTTVVAAQRSGVGPLEGTTSARDAVALLTAACDGDRYPLTSGALANSVHASRIPLGVTDHDVRVAHKTGSLTGVANDVARLECDAGTMLIAFLSRDQHDTLVTGYEMGICTRQLLQLWQLGVRRTVGTA